MIDSLGIMYKVASAPLSRLTYDEAIRFAMALLLDQSPRELPFWDKIEPLYTSSDKPAQMHPVTREAVDAILNDRMNEGV